MEDHSWMNRVLNRTFQNVNQIAAWGYPFLVDETGVSHRGTLQGPEYMKLIRKQIQKAKVRILDHSPALELLAY